LGGYRYTGGGGPFVSGNWGSGGGWSAGGGGVRGFRGGRGGEGGGGGGRSGEWRRRRERELVNAHPHFSSSARSQSGNPGDQKVGGEKFRPDSCFYSTGKIRG